MTFSSCIFPLFAQMLRFSSRVFMYGRCLLRALVATGGCENISGMPVRMVCGSIILAPAVTFWFRTGARRFIGRRLVRCSGFTHLNLRDDRLSISSTFATPFRLFSACLHDGLVTRQAALFVSPVWHCWFVIFADLISLRAETGTPHLCYSRRCFCDEHCAFGRLRLLVIRDLFYRISIPYCGGGLLASPAVCCVASGCVHFRLAHLPSTLRFTPYSIIYLRALPSIQVLTVCRSCNLRTGGVGGHGRLCGSSSYWTFDSSVHCSDILLSIPRSRFYYPFCYLQFWCQLSLVRLRLSTMAWCS